MDETALPPTPAAAPRPVSRVFAVALVLLAIIVAALWFDTRGRIGATQEELARRLRDIESESRDARALGTAAQEGLRDAQAKIGVLEAKLADSQNQQVALEALYQELARNRDEWQLAEIEQVLAIAQQQLQLSGNVRAALLALQLAEGRLSRADRPQFLPVRRALARDIERLKALPALDVPGLSLALDRLAASVDGLPLAFDERIERPATAKSAKAGTAAQEDGFFERLGGDVWRELRQLVVVRRVDAPEPPLLPPPQAWFLRENLKLRLLNARLALLTRDEAGYREDLRTAQSWIQRYFDARAKASQAALAQLKQLSLASVTFEPPSISDSLDAVRSFKTRRERGSS
ncbi:MAG TPA: uroporphyrinogen-III C-methyltransferase [Burkholderiales bacterium]|nr:uroporphyrinogen-III C-methyltransferase [Burkholderiales bacterium]